jgi:MFS family permease
MEKVRIKILLFINLLSLIGYYEFPPLYSLFAKGLNISPSFIGILWGYYTFVIALFVLIMGKIENRLPKKVVLVFGFLLYSLGSFAFLFVHNVESLILVFGLNALGAGFALPAYKTLYSFNQDKGRESEEWSWVDSGNMFAASIGSFIGGIVIGIYGFSGIFFTMGIIQGIAFLIAFIEFLL